VWVLLLAGQDTFVNLFGGDEVGLSLPGIVCIRASAGSEIYKHHSPLAGPIGNLLVMMFVRRQEITDAFRADAEGLELPAIFDEVSGELALGEQGFLWFLPRAIEQVLIRVRPEVMPLVNHTTNKVTESGIGKETAGQEEGSLGPMLSQL